MSRSESYAEFTEKQYLASVERRAKILREAVDDFERQAKDVRAREIGMSLDKFRFTYAASRSINALHWGVANAHLDTLVHDAAEADLAAREGLNDG